MPSWLPSFLLLPALCVGCAEWPRASNWPAANGEAAPVGEDPPEFGWTLLAAQPSVDSEPGSVASESLQPGHGARVMSQLDGTGWDDTAVVDFSRAGDTGGTDTSVPCVAESSFPPERPGNWTGDVDWRVLTVSAAGTLCSDLRADNTDLRTDVLLYTLDDCGTPVAAVVDGALPLGWRGDAQENTWSYPVEPAAAGSRIAVVAAGWAPESTDPATYEWGLALVASGDACPDLP